MTLAEEAVTPVRGGYAKVIEDSISPDGVRLTTIEGKFRRFVLAEANTHRVISKNSASSRAIPFEKQVAKIREDLAYPEVWATEQKGMQGGPPLDETYEEMARLVWEDAADEAIAYAKRLRDLFHVDDEINGGEPVKVHKSIVNRLLEPFMWHTVVFTATAWENFFSQRCHEDAQPEIRVFAEMAQQAMDESKPKRLVEGEWHLPYIDSEDYEAARHLVGLGESMYPILAKVSAARCARVSYLTHDGRRDIREDLDLYAKLTDRQKDAIKAHSPIHWSPLEHVATPWPSNRQDPGTAPWFVPLDGDKKMIRPQVGHLPKVGNLLAWRSLRTEVETVRGEVTYR